MFEKDLPGENNSGLSYQGRSQKLPLETCETMNNSWGFNITDTNYKTVKQLIHYLVNAAGRNANFLLNVGPMPNGKIQPEFIDTLQQIGKWLQVYGQSIYNTRGNIVTPQHWGVVTGKNKTLYVHIMEAPSQHPYIFIPGLKTKNYFCITVCLVRVNIKFKQLPEGSFIYLDGVNTGADRYHYSVKHPIICGPIYDKHITRQRFQTPDIIVDLARNIYKEYYLYLWHSGGAEWYMEEYAYAAEKIKADLMNVNNEYFIATENGSEQGYMKININEKLAGFEELNALEVERIYVYKKASGKKLGKQLMQTAMEQGAGIEERYYFFKSDGFRHRCIWNFIKNLDMKSAAGCNYRCLLFT